MSFFFFNDTATTEIYTLSLHDALPICQLVPRADLSGARPAREHGRSARPGRGGADRVHARSEEHTSELQSRSDLVCRLLLEKKKKSHSLSPQCTYITHQTHTTQYSHAY